MEKQDLAEQRNDGTGPLLPLGRWNVAELLGVKGAGFNSHQYNDSSSVVSQLSESESFL